MEIESFYTVIITAITVLGSAGAWRFYEKRADTKRDDENFMKFDCRERITKLEVLLERSSEEKDEMRHTILELTKEVAELSVKVRYLEDEKTKLIEANKRKRNQING
jgi:ribulose 1,5-bisphosphate carboxylase large subunit-like protein